METKKHVKKKCGKNRGIDKSSDALSELFTTQNILQQFWKFRSPEMSSIFKRNKFCVWQKLS
jgi:hypothetical protein